MFNTINITILTAGRVANCPPSPDSEAVFGHHREGALIPFCDLPPAATSGSDESGAPDVEKVQRQAAQVLHPVCDHY